MRKMMIPLLALAMTIGFFGCASRLITRPADGEIVSPTLIIDTPEPVPSQSAEIMIEVVTLYLPNDNADGYITATEELKPDTEAVVARLAELGAIPQGSAMISFDKNNAVIDMNTAFGEGVGSTGTAGELMILGSLVNTILNEYGLDSLTVTVDGKTLETGHNVYDYPLTAF